MEVEDLLTHIHAQLNNNHSDSPIHRKAAAILESLMHASNAVNNTLPRSPTSRTSTLETTKLLLSILAQEYSNYSKELSLDSRSSTTIWTPICCF